MLLNLGYDVLGSDLNASPVTERLESFGAHIFIGHLGGAATDVLSVEPPRDGNLKHNRTHIVQALDASLNRLRH